MLCPQILSLPPATFVLGFCSKSIYVSCFILQLITDTVHLVYRIQELLSATIADEHNHLSHHNSTIVMAEGCISYYQQHNNIALTGAIILLLFDKIRGKEQELLLYNIIITIPMSTIVAVKVLTLFSWCSYGLKLHFSSEQLLRCTGINSDVLENGHWHQSVCPNNSSGTCMPWDQKLQTTCRWRWVQ